MLIAAVDVGSIKSGRFRWWADPDEPGPPHDDPGALATVVRDALEAGERVALGFGCPLVLPVPTDAARIGAKRENEGNRPWSAGPGASVLPSGLVQLSWVLARLGPYRATTQPARWSDAVPLLLWESFGAGRAAGAVRIVTARLADGPFSPGGDVTLHAGDAPLNLAAAVAMQAGLIVRTDEVALPVTVVAGPAEPSAGAAGDAN